MFLILNTISCTRQKEALTKSINKSKHIADSKAINANVQIDNKKSAKPSSIELSRDIHKEKKQEKREEKKKVDKDKVSAKKDTTAESNIFKGILEGYNKLEDKKKKEDMLTILYSLYKENSEFTKYLSDNNEKELLGILKAKQELDSESLSISSDLMTTISSDYDSSIEAEVRDKIVSLFSKGKDITILNSNVIKYLESVKEYFTELSSGNYLDKLSAQSILDGFIRLYDLKSSSKKEKLTNFRSLLKLNNMINKMKAKAE